jgi:hypothetical protein
MADFSAIGPDAGSLEKLISRHVDRFNAQVRTFAVAYDRLRKGHGTKEVERFNSAAGEIESLAIRLSEAVFAIAKSRSSDGLRSKLSMTAPPKGRALTAKLEEIELLIFRVEKRDRLHPITISPLNHAQTWEDVNQWVGDVIAAGERQVQVAEERKSAQVDKERSTPPTGWGVQWGPIPGVSNDGPT